MNAAESIRIGWALFYAVALCITILAIAIALNSDDDDF